MKVTAFNGSARKDSNTAIMLNVVLEELKKQGREDIMVIAGGVIPTQDYEYLYRTGVLAIFGPGTRVADTGREILKVLLEAYE